MRRLNHAFSIIMVSFLIQSGNVSAAPETGTLPDTFPGSGVGASSPADGRLPPAYPEWPERPARREFIPPPPAGPYMSSALSEIRVFPDDMGGLQNEFKEPLVPSPFFEADMPWPETPDYASPEPWVPESGEYRFVPEDVVRQLETTIQDQRRQQLQRYMPYRGYPPAPPLRQPYYGYY
jgi:hypothetical protein